MEKLQSQAVQPVTVILSQRRRISLGALRAERFV
jgi:hypothetical protein